MSTLYITLSFLWLGYAICLFKKDFSSEEVIGSFVIASSSTVIFFFIALSFFPGGSLF